MAGLEPNEGAGGAQDQRRFLWKLSHAMPGLFDNHNRASCQSIRAFGKHFAEALNYKIYSSVAQTKENDSGLASLTKRYDLAKVEVKCHDHTGFSDRLFEDFTIGQSLKSLVSQWVASCPCEFSQVATRTSMHMSAINRIIAS